MSCISECCCAFVSMLVFIVNVATSVADNSMCNDIGFVISIDDVRDDACIRVDCSLHVAYNCLYIYDMCIMHDVFNISVVCVVCMTIVFIYYVVYSYGVRVCTNVSMCIIVII